MRDRFFFPAALALVAMMVFLAIRPGIGALPSGAVAGDGANYNKITIEGDYLHKVFAGGNAKTELVDGPDNKTLLYIEAETGALRDEPVRARPADDRGAMQIAMNYSAGRVGESGWRIFDLKPEFSDLSFDYDVPRIEGDQGVDYLGIRPVVPNKSRAVLIERITLDRIGPWETDDPA